MRRGDEGPAGRALTRLRLRADRSASDPDPRQLGATSEDGFGIVEVIAAFSIVFVGFFALAQATGSSSRMLTKGGQRQVATSEANARIEDFRNIPYSNVALTTQPVRHADASNPDFYVSTDGTAFDALHNGSPEALIVDTVNGQVVHLEEDVTIGVTVMDVYQYVTWVDDPDITGAQNYRRITVIVRYFAAGDTTRSDTVQVGALLTAGTLTIAGGSTLGPTQGSAAPTPTSTPTGGSCDGDVTAPTGGFSILSGTGAQTGYTASTTATLSLAPVDACTPISYRISNDGTSYSGWTTYDAGAPTTSWTLTAGDGTKSVWVQYRDGAANTATAGPETIVLDTTPPTVPGTLTRTVSCNGNDRTVTLTWGVSTDTNLLGYRVYKSVNGGDYSLLGSVATLSMSDTDLKTLTSLSYRVVAYDKAGNEGNPTNVITLSKNQCS